MGEEKLTGGLHLAHVSLTNTYCIVTIILRSTISQYRYTIRKELIFFFCNVTLPYSGGTEMCIVPSVWYTVT
jgi:hypothetical protein